MSRGVAVESSPTKKAALASVGMAFGVMPTLVCSIVAISVVYAQASAPRFEVASIKAAPPVTPEILRSSGRPLGVRIDKAQATFGGMALSALISYAYGIKLAQISGPEWLTTQRFDIVAKLPEGASTERAPEMMATLLAERFDLKLQRGSKQFSVYALVAAKAGMKLTPKPEGFDPKEHKDQIAIPILSLTLMLEQIVDLPVVDETGLQGQYLFESRAIQQAMMAGTTIKAQRAASSSGGVPEASEPASSDIAPLLLPLGIRLEKKKANLPTLAVKSMRQTPTEN